MGCPFQNSIGNIVRAANTGPDGFSGVFFMLSVPAFWMFFINLLDTRPGEAGLFVVFAAYAADRLLLKHLRRCLSLMINTNVQPVRVTI